MAKVEFNVDLTYVNSTLVLFDGVPIITIAPILSVGLIQSMTWAQIALALSGTIVLMHKNGLNVMKLFRIINFLLRHRIIRPRADGIGEDNWLKATGEN